MSAAESAGNRSARGQAPRSSGSRRGSGRARGGLAWWLALALLVVVLDQFTKVLTLGSFAYGESLEITSFFNLVRVHNTGAAFSFLAGASGWQRWFFIALGLTASGFIVWMLHRHAGQTLFCFAVTMVMGGAIGNVIDRAVHGYVVDMLDFHAMGWHFPAFNLADSAITLGACCLILDEVLRVRRGR